MRLPEADPADEDDVAGLLDKVQAEQVHHLLSVDLFGQVQSEGIEGLLTGKRGETDTPGDGAVARPGASPSRRAGEQGQVVPLLLGGGGDELVMVFAHEGELQGELGRTSCGCSTAPGRRSSTAGGC